MSDLVRLPDPKVGALQAVAPYPLRLVLNWGRRYSLWVFNFGLACCAIEFIAASMARHDFMRLGVIPFAHGPRQADLMVVSGTVTDKMAPAVRRLWEQMPEPKYVISFGACSNSGGPYWDSYCVTKGVDQIIPVDVYVPGCPPRPEALLQGIVKLQEKIAGERLARRYSAKRRSGAAAVTRGLVPPPVRRPAEPVVVEPVVVESVVVEPVVEPPVVRSQDHDAVIEFEPILPATGSIPVISDGPPGPPADEEPPPPGGTDDPRPGTWWRAP
jgi:NADH-quinone oxidoreductase subunit B